MRSNALRGAATAVIAIVGWAFVGCAHSTFSDPLGKHNSLEYAQKRYTELVRWGEIERAAEYVDPDVREAYLSLANGFHGIRVTDFESGAASYDPTEDTATIHVVYHAYSMSTFLEKRIEEKQEWHRDEGLANRWWVRPDLGQVVTGASGSH